MGAGVGVGTGQLLPVEFLAVTLSGQQPYWVEPHPPTGGRMMQLLPAAFLAVTLSGQQPYVEVAQLLGLGVGTGQLLPVEFLAVTLSGQQPYWVPEHPPMTQLLPVSFLAVTLSGQHPY